MTLTTNESQRGTNRRDGRETDRQRPGSPQYISCGNLDVSVHWRLSHIVTGAPENVASAIETVTGTARTALRSWQATVGGHGTVDRGHTTG